MVKNMSKQKTKKTLNFFYDKEADVLYVSRGKPAASDESSETEDEVVVRKNPKTGEITGLTIINFSKRSSKSDLKLNLPFDLSFR